MKEIAKEIIDIETIIFEGQIKQSQQLDEKILYRKTEVGKLDTTKGIYHIYQFYEEPIECFIGKKLDNKIKRLGPIDTTEIVMLKFQEFQKEHEKMNSHQKSIVSML